MFLQDGNPGWADEGSGSVSSRMRPALPFQETDPRLWFVQRFDNDLPSIVTIERSIKI